MAYRSFLPGYCNNYPFPVFPVEEMECQIIKNGIQNLSTPVDILKWVSFSLLLLSSIGLVGVCYLCIKSKVAQNNHRRVVPAPLTDTRRQRVPESRYRVAQNNLRREGQVELS